VCGAGCLYFVYLLCSLNQPLHPPPYSLACSQSAPLRVVSADARSLCRTQVITVTLQPSHKLFVACASAITISGLQNTQTEPIKEFLSSSTPTIFPMDLIRTSPSGIAQAAVWDQSSGTLTLTIEDDLDLAEYVVQFVVQNPSTAALQTVTVAARLQLTYGDSSDVACCAAPVEYVATDLFNVTLGSASFIVGREWYVDCSEVCI